MNRRTVLRASGSLAAPLFAGCFASDGSDGAPGTTATPSKTTNTTRATRANGTSRLVATTTDGGVDATVEVRAGGAIRPTRVSVLPGSAVEWTNESDRTHLLYTYRYSPTSADWEFDVELEPTESTSHTFEEKGLYDYYSVGGGRYETCGRVIVGDVAADAPLGCERRTTTDGSG